MEVHLEINLEGIRYAIKDAQWHAKRIIEEIEDSDFVDWGSEEQRKKAERILTPLMNRIKETVSELKQDMEKALKEMEEPEDE